MPTEPHLQDFDVIEGPRGVAGRDNGAMTAVERASTRRTSGLSSEQAATLLKAHGPNVLPTPPEVPAWRRLGAEFVHFFALLFWGASALAFLGGLPQLGAAILVVILLNGLFAFAQEQRAHHAAQRIRDMLPRTATVVRDGVPEVIPAEDLVVGDLVSLIEGDRLSADLRLEQGHALAIDTSMLSGESKSAHPDEGDTLYAGCFVVEGEGRAIVTAVGRDTRLAAIAELTRVHHAAPTPLRLELARVSRLLALVAITVGVVFFAIAVVIGTPVSDGFVFAIGVTVAVVPCGLLPTVTLSLAIGAQRMANRNALVRNLEAVETLGSTTFICTDKTGTLTQNQMAVTDVWMPNGSAQIDGDGYEPIAEVHCASAASKTSLKQLARAAARCSNGRIIERDGQWKSSGDPMEAAIDALGKRVGFERNGDEVDSPECARFPFDPRRRRMSIVAGSEVLVKGAPDSVIPVCRPTDDAEAAVRALARRGLRVLAVASRPLGDEMPRTADGAERDLSLLGLIALEDPPRRGVADVLARCRHAGIRVAMLTGDHPETAKAIANEVGLLSDGAVLVGHDLPEDDEILGALIDRDAVVIARVTPEDKLRIAQVLRRRGHVVAMTGDGVNDAPALREAAIGVAMGRSGTDVARETADLVLLDDDFATIVAAIEQGRSTFANIRRFLTYHLTDNVAELTPFLVWALSGGRIPLAIGVLQVLALDIGTDILPALALGAEPPGAYVLDQPPITRHLLDRQLFQRAFLWLGPVEATISMLAFFATFAAAGWRPGDDFPEGSTLLAASGAAFTAVVLGQAANAFACRSTVLPAWRVPLSRNRLLVGAVAAELAMLAAFLFVPPLAALLDQAPPTAVGLIVALAAVPGVLGIDWLFKRRVSLRTQDPSSPALSGGH